jgi:excinuclease ABC subunit C
MPQSDFSHLLEKLDVLPQKPGCYLYKDTSGQILYVGKAINLRSRVRSYFQKSANHTVKIRRLVDSVRDLDYIVVESELEALVLECNLIKKYQPHYNVRLRDDKHYPYLCVTTSEPYPRLLLTRRVRQDGNRYFGPYTSSRAVYSTMDLIKRIFPIVSCGKPFTGIRVQNPCLYYHMGQCLAPCAGLAEKPEYNQAIKGVTAFLEGKQEQIVRDLRRRMELAAEDLEFEKAAKVRDQLQAVEDVMARQKVISTQMIDQDVVAMVGADGADGAGCVQMFYIRGGKLIGQNTFVLEGSGDERQNEAVQEFLKQYYQDAPYVPQEILLPCDIDETAIVQQWLKQKRGSKVEITVPSRGDKKRLVEMATENAQHALERLRADMRAKLGNREKALFELAEALGLEAPPLRIECYDISNFQGEHFVGSMVVFTDGQVDKAEYRRFKIKFHENKPDDFAMMREVLTRRLNEGKIGNPKFARMPSLIIVDGGRGQVTAAVEALHATGFIVPGEDPALPDDGRRTTDDRRHAMDGGLQAVAPEIGIDGFNDGLDELSVVRRSSSVVIPLCGLAKRFELLILPNEPDPVALPRTAQALYLVQRIRDEAHRFANAYRITLQSKKQTQSVLDTIPGIGPTRRKALLKRFGSVDGLRSASLEEMAATPGMTRQAAEAVQAYLKIAS